MTETATNDAETSRRAMPADRGFAVLFAGSVFLGAFLLFQVQPVIGKFILPWFGSSPAVWTTCMLFFQVLLLGGYAYAHLLVRLRSTALQGAIHGVLLLAAVLMLPITPDAVVLPEDVGGDPTWRILALLGVSVGLPYLVLSATGPLLLGWRALLAPDRPAYRLYALSNAGSLLALLSYPFVFEPVLRLEQQTGAWSAGLWRLCAGLRRVCGGGGSLGPIRSVGRARRSGRQRRGRAAADGRGLRTLGGPGCVRIGAAAGDDQPALLGRGRRAVSLGAATEPLLGDVHPLLRSSALVSPRRVRDPAAAVRGGRVLSGQCGRQPRFDAADLWLLAGAVRRLQCSHGELVRARPGARHLTLFFLSVSLGGAVGGLAVAVVAPAVFSSIVEFHVAVVAAVGLLLLAIWRQGVVGGRGVAAGFVGWVVLAGLFAWKGADLGESVRDRQRNFYGVLTVRQSRGDDGALLRTSLSHGRIHHGNQSGAEPGWPNSYYGPLSGVGLAVRRHPQRVERGLRIGVIGLGAGTMAAYASAQIDPFAEGVDALADVEDEDMVRRVGARSHGDYVRFYEINPLVIDWAGEWFSFLDDARTRGADVEVVAGDARLAMQAQLAGGEPQRFDVLAVDAFTGDAIPIHLLTAECLAIYWQHLAEDGVLAVHVSNRFIDLVPVVHRHGVAAGKSVLVVDDDERDSLDSHGSVWVLVTDSGALLDDPVLTARSERLPASDDSGPLWTDDYSSVATLLK